MEINKNYKWQIKDTLFVFVFVALIIAHLVLYISQNGFSSIFVLLEQTFLVTFSLVGLFESLHLYGYDFLVPGFMLHKPKQERIEELQNCLGEAVEHHMKDIIPQSIDAYFSQEVKFIKNYSEEKTHYILSQLGIKANQFDHLRIELVKMRSLQLADLNDAQEKIRQFIRCKEPFVTDLHTIDSAKCTYPFVRFYLNFNDAMYFTGTCRELVAILNLLISERFELSAFDKIVIPYDSNYILGVEVGKILEKPVVHMRRKEGRIEKEKCWDGNLSPIDRVIIVHDVLVTSDQIIHALDKLPPTCHVLGLCCLVARKERDGIAKLNARHVKTERILDLNDEDISNIM